MVFFWRIILGIVVVIFGFFMVYKTDAFQTWTGQIDWAEQKFGYGGTRVFLKIFGLGLIFLGVFIMTGIFNDIMGFLVGLLT